MSDQPATDAVATQVFLGPSLSWGQARDVLPDALYRPPAKAGDVYVAFRSGAKVIAIIDGYFEQVPAVWHKEVLYALSAGVHVFGASSMGALRAAELHPFGMIGVGRIFAAYRDGTYEDDDEVVVVHGGEEVGFAAISEAMVNIRDGLGLALAQGLVTQPTHDVIVRVIKGNHYPRRSWLLVPEIAERERLPAHEIAALMDFVRRTPNIKQRDAIELLAVVRSFVQESPPPSPPRFEFESTVFWDQLVSGVRTGPGASASVSIEAIRSHVGLVEDDAEAIFEGALLMYLAVKEAHRVGIRIDGNKISRMTERFCSSHGLETPAAKKEWLSQNSMGEHEFSALMEVLALVEAVAKHHSTGLDAFLPAELQRRGRFEPVVSAIAEKRRILAEFGNTFPSAEDFNTTTEDLLDWYEQRYRPLVVSLEDHLDSRRFVNANRFVRELLTEFVRQGLDRKDSVRADG
jgi:hypothetical protein